MISTRTGALTAGAPSQPNDPPGTQAQVFVVAIFGGGAQNEPNSLALAEMIGRSIAVDTDWIVLSGGNGPDDSGVRGHALLGAAAQSGRRWIGVPRGNTAEARDVGSGRVLQTSLKHKRNYLEACLCDAAVVLPGADGTASEAVSTLCLHKPCVFVGDEWENLDLLQDLPTVCRGIPLDWTARKQWIRRAFIRLGDGRPSPIDRHILRDVKAENLVGIHEHVAHLSTYLATTAVASIQTMLDGSTPTHAFPDLRDDPDHTLRAEYDIFVRRD